VQQKTRRGQLASRGGRPFNECFDFRSEHRPSHRGVMMAMMPGGGDDHKL